MKLTSSERSNTAADEYQITQSRTDSLMSLKQGLARAVLCIMKSTNKRPLISRRGALCVCVSVRNDEIDEHLAKNFHEKRSKSSRVAETERYLNGIANSATVVDVVGAC